MDGPGALDYLVLTDAESSDVSVLYPPVVAVAGADNVSVPLDFEIEDLENVDFRTDDTDVGEVLWSGVLSLPSGRLLVSNQSMRPLRSHRLTPGNYEVSVLATNGARERLAIICVQAG